MMFASLCSKVFDPIGFIRLNAEPDSELLSVSRRISRTATLDGGVMLVDNGYAPGDQTLTINSQLTRAQEAIVSRLIQIYPELTLATPTACFLGAVETYSMTRGVAKIKFLVKEKISGD